MTNTSEYIYLVEKIKDGQRCGVQGRNVRVYKHKSNAICSFDGSAVGKKVEWIDDSALVTDSMRDNKWIGWITKKLIN